MPRSELNEKNAKTVLVRHGLIDEDISLDVQRLTGGVSSTILMAEADGDRWVLKQPLGTFQVRDDWQAATERAEVEYEVGALLHDALGESIVPVHAYDSDNQILIIEAVDKGWTTWKEHLLAGRIEPTTARAAGDLLARLHAVGEDLGEPDRFRNERLFHEQRIDPYFQTAAQRVPEASTHLAALGPLFHQRDDLVHGDFSPKNLFTDADLKRVRLIDHEVATRGDGAFDLAFVLNHLLLKSLHMPQHAERLHECMRTLNRTYLDRRAAFDRTLEARAMRFLGGLLIARVAGKSPVEYLETPAQQQAVRLGTQILNEAPRDLDAALLVAADATGATGAARAAR